MTWEQMKVNNTFRCDPSSIEQAPCPEPQECHYNESIPGGERSMWGLVSLVLLNIHGWSIDPSAMLRPSGA
jgi:hypothetical protein